MLRVYRFYDCKDRIIVVEKELDIMRKMMKKRPTPTLSLRRRLLNYNCMRDEMNALQREIERQPKQG